MSVLTKMDGEFILLDENYKSHTFYDTNDIPDDFDCHSIVKFTFNIPPSPHTLQQHEEISIKNKYFKDFVNKVFNA